jgi:hypothetical protein
MMAGRKEKGKGEGPSEANTTDSVLRSAIKVKNRSANRNTIVLSLLPQAALFFFQFGNVLLRLPAEFIEAFAEYLDALVERKAV